MVIGQALVRLKITIYSEKTETNPYSTGLRSQLAHVIHLGKHSRCLELQHMPRKGANLIL